MILQISIFNNMNLFEIINPSFYLLIFIKITCPVPAERTLILLGFLAGIIIDLTSQSYGCHTIAAITVCYMRGLIENYCFGVNANIGKVMLSGVPVLNRITFFLLIILLHQLIYYSLIFFSPLPNLK